MNKTHSRRRSESFGNIDISKIIETINEIAYTVDNPFQNKKIELSTSLLDDVEELYQEIKNKEDQVKIMTDICYLMIRQTKKDWKKSETEFEVFEEQINNIENEVSLISDRKTELNHYLDKLNEKKYQLESYLNELEQEYENNQESCIHTMEEKNGFEEVKKNYENLLRVFEPTSEILEFYRKENEELRKDLKKSRNDSYTSMIEIEAFQEKFSGIFEIYENFCVEQKALYLENSNLKNESEKYQKEIAKFQEKNSNIALQIEILKKKNKLNYESSCIQDKSKLENCSNAEVNLTNDELNHFFNNLHKNKKTETRLKTRTTNYHKHSKGKKKRKKNVHQKVYLNYENAKIIIFCSFLCLIPIYIFKRKKKN